MRPKERRETGQSDLLRSRLDSIIDMNHALVKLARTVDWGFLEERFGAVYSDKPGQPPLPTRLMAGLAILKHTHDLSDEVLCERWVENPYYQFFCGEEFFQHRLVFDRSSLTRWRQRMGEEKLQALIQESLSVATRTDAIKPSELSRVIVDTDKGYRGHNAPPDYKFKVYTSTQRRRLTPQIKREMRRRAAVEPVIGHLKNEHRMDRNYLHHRSGDANNATLAAIGYNFSLLLRWLRLLLRLILAALPEQPAPAAESAAA